MSFNRLLNALLVLVPIAIAGNLLGWSAGWILLFSAGGMIPLAGLLGQATEELAIHIGPRFGGLLNATMGNAAELIIAIVALNKGLTELVKASITGSILGNLLLILGLSLLLGGIKNGLQTFDRRTTGLAATQMSLAIIALAIPTLFDQAIPTAGQVLTLSEEVGVVMILLYVLYLFYVFRQSTPGERPSTGVASHGEEAEWSARFALGILVASTLAIVFLSEILVGAVEEVIAAFDISEVFLGVILIPLVGNAAEHLVGVTAAYKNQMELSLAISLGSSMQIALFVAPLLVFISLLVGPEPMDLVFTSFELIALVAATLIATFVSLDGESNWLEGAQLLAVYLILGLGFFFL